MNTETPERELRKQAFLADADLADARREPLSGDASTRAYERLHRPGRTPLILMDAPPRAESGVCRPGMTPSDRVAAGYNALARLAASRIDAFVAIGRYLRRQGLSSPEIFAFDADAGFAVVEDLGEGLLAALTGAGEAPLPYYQAAIDVLLHLHRTTPPMALPLGDPEVGAAWPLLSYDGLALGTGADLFVSWWPRYAEQVRLGPNALAEWDGLWAPIRARGEAGAAVLAHRDYHAENLVWLPGRQGVARLGLLDFQDALLAHPAWDLLSLLQDARRDVTPELEAAMQARYLAGRPDLDRDAFLRDYAGLAALNNARIIGLFARLIVRDGKPRYAGFLPRMWRLLERNLAHPDLTGLQRWFDRHVPHEARA